MFWRVALLIGLFSTVQLVDAPVRSETNLHDISRMLQGEALSDDVRQAKFSPRLAVNQGSQERLIVPNKCRGAGEAELQHLTRVAPVEESFAYIPSLCLWLEVGYDETPTRVRLDLPFINRLLRDVPSIDLHHIHVGGKGAFAGYFPAYDDMIAVVLLNPSFNEVETARIRHSAVNEVGTIDYTFVATPDIRRLVELIKASNLGAFLGQNLAYVLSGEAYRRRYHAMISRCVDRVRARAGTPEDCFPMTAESFRLTFRPAALHQVNVLE